MLIRTRPHLMQTPSTRTLILLFLGLVLLFLWLILLSLAVTLLHPSPVGMALLSLVFLGRLRGPSAPMPGCTHQ